jgi:hypothetical protein
VLNFLAFAYLCKVGHPYNNPHITDRYCNNDAWQRGPTAQGRERRNNTPHILKVLSLFEASRNFETHPTGTQTLNFNIPLFMHVNINTINFAQDDTPSEDFLPKTSE